MGIQSILKTFSATATLLLAHYGAFTCATKPQTYGIVLVRAFDTLDVYAPIEILQLVSSMHKIQISLIAETPEVTTEPMAAMMNPFNSTVWPRVPTTLTFATAPRDFDVLIIPGGPGVRSPYINSTLEWIKEVAARAGTVITIFHIYATTLRYA
ncbi:hypothetical protein BCR34DRAFT_563416 [Clohesyomyces aquaticus]|uniref:Class I glutamine amidotransferase-like protein n=1 Tax=Clohesyomyces aquaticus TaxID=1231657 RepID=A0A1Y1ZQU9_9PLEO|nr:hypothetical protein BCR34DRAFT_563416 [Clohesyomyces aquaticus]